MESGPESLVDSDVTAIVLRGALRDEPFELPLLVGAIVAIGRDMVVYHVYGGSNWVLKVPRSEPGSAEHARVMRGYGTALDAEKKHPGLLGLRLMEVEIEGTRCFVEFPRP